MICSRDKVTEPPTPGFSCRRQSRSLWCPAAPSQVCGDGPEGLTSAVTQGRLSGSSLTRCAAAASSVKWVDAPGLWGEWNLGLHGTLSTAQDSAPEVLHLQRCCPWCSDAGPTPLPVQRPTSRPHTGIAAGFCGGSVMPGEWPSPSTPSYCCHQLPQIEWLETTQANPLRFRGQKSKIKVWAELVPHLLCLSQRSEAPTSLRWGLLPPRLQPLPVSLRLSPPAARTPGPQIIPSQGPSLDPTGRFPVAV